MVLGPTTPELQKSRSLLSFRPKRYPTSRTFCRHHLGSPRRPTLASLLRRPASPGAPPINPGGGFGTMRQQAIQPASTSASAVWSALLQPTRPLSTSPGTMLRVTLDELHALSPDAVYTPPGASRPSRPQRYAQDTSRAAEVIDPGPPSVLRAPVLAPVRPSSTRPRWMPRVLGALRPCKRKICRKRVHALPSSDCWHILPWLEPEHFPALHPRRRHLPPPLPGHPAPPPPPVLPLSKAVHTSTCTLGPVPVLSLRVRTCDGVGRPIYLWPPLSHVPTCLHSFITVDSRPPRPGRAPSHQQARTPILRQPGLRHDPASVDPPHLPLGGTPVRRGRA